MELSVARRVQETEKLRLFFSPFFFAESVSRSLKVSRIFFYKFLGVFLSLSLLKKLLLFNISLDINIIV